MKKFATLALSIMLTSVVGAQTPCTITHNDLPFVEDFQTHTDSDLFVGGCWRQTAVVQTPVAAPSPHAGIYCDSTGNRSLRLAVAHGRIPLMVTLPPVDSLSDLEISFNFRKEGPEWDGIFNHYNSVITLGVLEDTNDMNSFVPLFNGSAAADSWFKYTVRLPRYHGSGHILAFRGYKTGNYPNINNPNILADTDTTFVYMYIDSIDIHPIADCGRVDHVEGFNISETGASVRWNDPERAGNFKVNLTGGGLDTTVFTTDTRVTFTDLIPNTEYTARVSVPCVSGEEPVAGAQFTTGGCLTPDSITISDITDTSVRITWVPRSEETSWEYQLRISDSNGIHYDFGFLDTTVFEHPNLRPNTHYVFEVRPDCFQSAWSDTIGFSPLPAATDTTATDTTGRTVTGTTIAPSINQTISIYPNPSHGEVTVSVDQPSVVSVIDLQGRTVIPSATVNSSLQLPTSDLPKGAYFVRVSNEEGCLTRKLIMQ